MYTYMMYMYMCTHSCIKYTYTGFCLQWSVLVTNDKLHITIDHHWLFPTSTIMILVILWPYYYIIYCCLIGKYMYVYLIPFLPPLNNPGQNPACAYVSVHTEYNTLIVIFYIPPYVNIFPYIILLPNSTVNASRRTYISPDLFKWYITSPSLRKLCFSENINTAWEWSISLSICLSAVLPLIITT